MNGYQIVKDGILISTTPSYTKLFVTSKIIIEENSAYIESCIKSIDLIEAAVNEASKLLIPEKENFIALNNDIVAFYKLYCFFLNFSIDFSICSREFCLAKSKPEQIFFIKAIYIELYRFLERHNIDLGIIKRLLGKTDDYKEYNNCLKNFRSVYYEQIKSNRNLFFAHLDRKSQYVDYYRLILRFDVENEVKMCSSFLVAQEKLSKIYRDLFSQKLVESAALNEFLRKRDEELQTIVDGKLKKLSSNKHRMNS